MKSNYENIDDLLGKYLAGEASESERTLVDVWINESGENQKYFAQIKKIFVDASAIREVRTYDTDQAWNKLRARLPKKTAPVIPIGREQSSWSYLWKIAAGFLILLTVGIYLYQSQYKVQPVEVIAEKQAVNDTLPDGSNVFLNKKTRVVYAYDKKSKTHDVKLQGEAYFNIHHKKKEKFIIDAGDVFIRDIGTSFNVKAYPESDLVEVLVEEGEIVFFTADNPGIHLKESGKAVYNKKTKQFTIDQPDPNVVAYKTKFFIFSAAPLSEVVKALNEVYDVPLVIPAHLDNCPITVSFRNETIEEIAAIIAETLSLTVTKENGKIILNGKGCE